MKHLLLFILLAFFSCKCYCQKILSDEIDEDSIRCITTSYITARSFTDKVVWNFSLGATKNIKENSPIHFILSINLNAFSNIKIKDTGLLLIKTFNDDILELTNASSSHDSITIGYSYLKPIYGNIGTIRSNNLHKNTAYYFVTENDIKKLNSGVKKVRIETEDGFNEKEYSKDKCGSNLYKTYLKLKDKMENSMPTHKKGIREDF